MYISIQTAYPALLNKGDKSVTIHYTGFITEPIATSNPVSMSITIYGTPDVVFFDTAGNETSQISWQQIMTANNDNYQYSVMFRVKITPQHVTAITIVLTAKDAIGNNSSDYPTIQFA